ncbi:MAG: SMC-Scp complex subunit ScpB [Alicyclobacillaceae bacterium]|nr:SMC-Scp complex subunit ScpB [Alicyclobacillaceae bacterium]
MMAVIEGLLFAAGDEGLTAEQLAEYTGLPVWEVQSLCDALGEDLQRQGRGIRLRRVQRAYQLTTAPEHAPYLERMSEVPKVPPLSQAALETLAIIAYRQPVTRMEIEEIRGVKSDRALATLLGRGLVREAGRADGPGRPILYATTKYFLEYFGFRDLEDLPSPEWEERPGEGELFLFARPESSAEENVRGDENGD